jgi:hydrogenase maturation protease
MRGTEHEAIGVQRLAMRDQRWAVIGLGNPLRRDDGIGPRVVEELARCGLPEGVAALDVGTGGLDLLRVLEEWDRVVVVDAADVGREPGQFVRFTPDQAHLARAADHFSLHHAGLSEVLALAGALGRTLPEMVIFGVQPAEIDWGEGLSPAVEAALPALADAVLEEIAGWPQDAGD